MASLDELAAALIKADAAGDTEGAATLAKAYEEQKVSAPAGVLQDTGQGRFSSFASNVGRGVAGIVPNVVGGVGYLTGADTLVQGAESMEQGINEALPINPLYADEFAIKAGNVLGQGVSTLATAGVGGIAGKALGGVRAIGAGAQTGALLPAFLSGAREGGQTAEQYGMTGGTAYGRTVLGGLNELATEKLMFGLGTETAAARRLLGESLERGTGALAKSIGTEAGEEAASQLAGNVETKLMAPEGVQTPGVTEGVLDAALLGGVGGAFFGGVNALTTPRTPAPVAAEQPYSIESGEQPPLDLEESVSPLQVADVQDPVVEQLVTQAAETAIASAADNPVTAAVIETLSQPAPSETPVSPEQPVPEAQTPPETPVAPLSVEAVPVEPEQPIPTDETVQEIVPAEGEVQETSGPAPVESLAPDSTPEVQAQEGAALRQGEGQEVAAPQPSQRVRFRREGNFISGTYEGQDALGRHVVNVNGKKEYSASLPQLDEGPIGNISVAPTKRGKKVLTSRRSGRPVGLTVQETQKVVDQFRKQLPKAPTVRIITRADLETLPEFQEARNAIESAGDADLSFSHLEGWLNRNTREVFLVADNLTDLRRARKVLIHEIIGHGGILSVASLAEMRRIVAIIKRVMPELVAHVENAYKGAQGVSEADKLGEILAIFSEEYNSADPANLPQGWNRVWQDIKQIVKAIIRKLGGDPNAFDDADLHWFYTNAVRSVFENGLSEEDLTLTPQSIQASTDMRNIQPSINFPGTPEALEEIQRQQEAGVSNARETRARFAPYDQRNAAYIPTTEAEFKQAAADFIDSMPLEQAAQAVLDNNLPDNMKMGTDGRYRITVAEALRRLTTAVDSTEDPYEQARLQALTSQLALRYAQTGTSDGRALKSGATASAMLAPIAPVLAAQKVLRERADRTTSARFDGGAEEVTKKVDDLARESGRKGGQQLADTLSGEETSEELRAADSLRTRAQDTAERIFQFLVRPKEPGEAPTPDPVRELYNRHLKTPLDRDGFVSGMVALGVEQQTAETLFTTAADEIRGRETTRRLKGEAKERRTHEIAENRASRLIYKVEERLRQGSKDLGKSASGDSINQAFRDQVKEASDWPVFRDRLAALNVGEEVAQRLFRTAEREAEDLAAVRQVKEDIAYRERRDKILAKDSPKLVEMLNALRAKLYPEMNWRDIFEDLPDQQLARQKEIYDRLRLDERIQGLTTEEAVALTNELDKAWQRQRRKVFNAELERQGVLGERASEDKEKVKKALPKLLRAINLGVFNSEMFREAIAPEYGLRPITATEAKELRKLAQEAWLQPEGILRNKKMGQLLDSLQKATGSSTAELVNNYWVASVLTGFATQFDTFMSAANGLGNNLIQAGSLLARGRATDAYKTHAQWWAGLKQGALESMQILANGDYSVLKRFSKDLNKAMEGESNFRPVPLGESLWKNGNLWQKYGMAPVMMWTGRLMSAADHINNTATTYGAMAAARALHPEIYGRKSAFTEEEKTAAREQALREVTGGKEPANREERNTVSVRTREILNGLLEEPQQEEASFIGDQAAYQNDPIGLFGSFYHAVNAGVGTLERATEKISEDPRIQSEFLRAMLAGLSGGLRGLTGTKFMRFGFNFGNDITQYIPGTYLLQHLAPVYGSEMSKSQQDLLLGKNLFGLMAASTIAALFLGKDDDDEGWHIEGNWSGLTNDFKNQLRSSGKEPLTIWRRREDGSIQRISYRSWPTSGIFVAVGSMNDQKRYNPGKWAEESLPGHLLRAVTNGALQVKDLTAMQGLAEIFGASSFNTDPENDFMERMIKLPVKFAGGFIPTMLKDIDAWEDPRSFRPETLLGEFGRNVPIARRYVADGRPLLNLLGEDVQLNRQPWRRVYTESKEGEAYDVLGKLLARGLSLQEPSGKRVVLMDGKRTTLEALGPEAEWEFARILGGKYKKYLEQDGDSLLAMPTDRAQKRLRSRSQDLGDQAEMETIRLLKNKK